MGQPDRTQTRLHDAHATHPRVVARALETVDEPSDARADDGHERHRPAWAHVRRPRVSIITPFRNAGPLFVETLDSILTQTCGDWESLLIDDGSTDCSSEIARAYATRFPDRFTYVEHDGHATRGVCASRNRGLALARGEYIALLDSDDVWLPGKLAYQLGILERHPDVGLVCGTSLYWHSWADASRRDVAIPVGCAQDVVYEPPALMKVLYPLADGDAPCPCGVIFRKSATDRLGGFEESFTGIHQVFEDQAFLCKMYLNLNVYVSSACLDKYRQRPGSLVDTVHRSGNYDAARARFLEWLDDYMRMRRAGDRDTVRLLRAAMLPYRHPLLHKLTVAWPQRVRRKLRDNRFTRMRTVAARSADAARRLSA